MNIAQYNMNNIVKIKQFQQEINETIDKHLEYLRTNENFDNINQRILNATIDHYGRIKNVLSSQQSDDDDDTIFDDDSDNDYACGSDPVIPDYFYNTGVNRRVMGINKDDDDEKTNFYGFNLYKDCSDESSDSSDSSEESSNLNPIINNTKKSLRDDIPENSIILENNDPKIYEDPI